MKEFKNRVSNNPNKRKITFLCDDEEEVRIVDIERCDEEGVIEAGTQLSADVLNTLLGFERSVDGEAIESNEHALARLAMDEEDNVFICPPNNGTVVPLSTPKGGETGQVLTKLSGNDHDACWAFPFLEELYSTSLDSFVMTEPLSISDFDLSQYKLIYVDCYVARLMESDDEIPQFGQGGAVLFPKRVLEIQSDMLAVNGIGIAQQIIPIKSFMIESGEGNQPGLNNGMHYKELNVGIVTVLTGINPETFEHDSNYLNLIVTPLPNWYGNLIDGMPNVNSHDDEKVWIKIYGMK